MRERLVFVHRNNIFNAIQKEYWELERRTKKEKKEKRSILREEVAIRDREGEVIEEREIYSFCSFTNQVSNIMFFLNYNWPIVQ